MKTSILAALVCLITAGANASAETFVTVNDPSGAPMCFDAAGEMVPLSLCQPQTYTLRFDPSGARMCFDSDGYKAPLALCEPEAFVVRHDPTGSPMCFDLDGLKAPLAYCQKDEIAVIHPDRLSELEHTFSSAATVWVASWLIELSR